MNEQEPVNEKWGGPISVKRQVELQGILDAWNAPDANHRERKGPFDGEKLIGADVSWLAEQSGRSVDGSVLNLNLAGANLFQAYLQGANLSKARLEGVSLVGAHLKGADLCEAHLEGASLARAHMALADLTGTYLTRCVLSDAELERVDFTAAHLEDSFLDGAVLDGANLSEAQLSGAILTDTHLRGTYLQRAYLEGASLRRAHLEGADLDEAHMERADLTGASFDKTSHLNNATLTGASFDQVSFDNTNLTVVDWSLVTTLGDERTARERKDADGKPKPRDQRLSEFKAAVRANRVLSVNLQAQGLAEEGDRFAYQAKKLQRQVLWYQRKPGAYLFSWLLAGLAGYGYRLRRIFIVYGLAVLLFAAGYFLAGGVTTQAHLSLQQQALDALQVSLNAIHGRVFFTQLGLDTLQSWLATLESIVGIVIEGVFVAMLIQRFFAR